MSNLGYEAGGPGSCKGDSGGPIVKYIDIEDRYVLVGIVQGGVEACGHPDYPGIFVRVGHPEVLAFIQNATGLGPGEEITTTTSTTPTTPFDPCQSLVCGGNARCIGRGRAAICECRSGFDGDPYAGCKIADPCIPSPCGTNSRCIARNNVATCRCQSGYRGDPFTRCSRKIRKYV